MNEPDAPLRLVFMGTSAFAVPALERLAELGALPVAVYTQPPRPAGRGHKLKKSEVHEVADRLGIEVRTPEGFGDDGALKAIRALRADAAIVASYGLLLPRPVLDAPALGCFNLHASILPRWRGASPIQHAILHGDATTGVTIFRLDEGLDTGPVLATSETAIEPGETAASLHDRLAVIGADMLPDLLDRLREARDTGRPLPLVSQPEAGVTVAERLSRRDGIIDFTQSATAIERRLRAFDPWPGCWSAIGEERLRLIAGEVTDGEGEPGTVIGAPLVVACGEGALSLTRVQRPGRKPMSAEDMVRGFPVAIGTHLG